MQSEVWRVKRNRNKGAALLLALQLCFLTACGGHLLPKANDITNVELMRTMALDKGKKKAVLVTVSSAVKAGEDGSEPTPPVVLSEEGNTVYAACLSIQTQGDNYVSFGAVEECLVSEEMAAEGLPGVLDLMERDYEMRMDTNLFLCAGEQAGQFLQKMATKKTSASDRLTSVARDYALESEGWPVTVREVLIDLADNGCALLPAIELGEEDEEATIEAEGMVWRSDGGIQRRLKGKDARSAAILYGKAVGGAVEVTLSDGTTAGLSLDDAACRWEPAWDGERMTGLTAQIQVKADIAELMGGADPERPEVIQELEQRLAEALQRPAQALLEETQQKRADIFHLRRRLMAQCPLKSGRIEENWETWYPTMTLSAAVSAQVERSYEVSRGSEAA